MNTIHVTPRGLGFLRDELARVQSEYADLCGERTRAVELSGDGWHDNPYLNHLQQREAALNHEIARLLGLLASAVLLDPVPVPRPTNRTAIGSIVTCAVTDVRTGSEQRQTWEIVGYGETQRDLHRLAYNAPLARALLGCSAGDVVEATLPAGAVEIEIVVLHSDWGAASHCELAYHA
jgi:transcription elongation factor GreA